MQPMLAGKTDGKNLRYPLLVSPKLDGIRAIIINETVLSRKLKPFPNKYVQKIFGKKELNGFDGEFIIGLPTEPDAFRKTASGVMTIEGECPEIKYYVFDDITNPTVKFETRFFDSVYKRINKLDKFNVLYVSHVQINNQQELLTLEEKYLKEGYEGIMLRDPNGPYKYGRSTLNEGWLLKLKRFCDSEAVIQDTIELMHNENEAIEDELGHTKRSSCQDGKVPAGKLGALSVQDCKTKVSFEIGIGFTNQMRVELWENRKEIIGKLVKYRYFPTGSKDKPRFPTFIGFRDPIDM